MSFILSATLAAQINPTYPSPRFVLGLGAGTEMRYAMATISDQNADGIDDLLVGITSEATSPPPGRVYIVSGASDILVGQNRILAEVPNTSLSPTFGHCVSSYSDYSGDGREDYLIGDPANQSVVSGALDSANTPQFQFLLQSWTGTTGNFGHSVVRLPTLGNAMDLIAIGNPEFIPAGTFYQSGSVEVFSIVPYAQIRAIVGTIASNYPDRLGSSLIAYPDIDGDFSSELIIGGSGLHNASNFNRSGGAQLYVSMNGFAGSPAKRFYGRLEGELLGSSAAVIGDTNGDGWPEIALTAPMQVTSGGVTYWRGSVRVYDGGTIADATILAVPVSDIISNITVGNFDAKVGESISGGADVDGDGTPDLVLGAPSRSGVQDGHYYGYSITNGQVEVATARPSPTFGAFVHCLGDSVIAIDPVSGLLYAY